MSSRLIMVTPHPWGVPHPVNDHIAELATAFLELRDGGDAGVPNVVIVAPSADRASLRATRRALRQLARGEDPARVLSSHELQQVAGRQRLHPPHVQVPVLALGIPIGPASVALRSSLRIVMDQLGPDVVYVHDPLDSDLTRFVVRTWPGLMVAAMHEVPQAHVLQHVTSPFRDRLLDQVDAWIAPADHGAGFVQSLAAFIGIEAGRIHEVPTIAPVSGEDASDGVGQHDQESVDPNNPHEGLIVVGRGASDDAAVRELLRSCAAGLPTQPVVSLALLSRWSAHHRPPIPAKLRGRVSTIRCATREASQLLLRQAQVFVALPGTPLRLIDEARAAGVPVVRYPVTVSSLVDAVLMSEQLASATKHAPAVLSDGDTERASGRVAATATHLAQAHLAVIRSVADRRQVRPPGPGAGDRTCLIDLHMHTSHSWDCATDPEALLYVARKVGLTAVAVTDHNEISGALACAELADQYGIQVIVGEEIKTSEGEVIGLFLQERIEPGMSWMDTIRTIREQDGLVYVPHPFDRLHTIPSARTLRDSIEEIDAFETYNARLAFEQFNRDAERFARKYNLIEGAGSDAHVVQGLGTAAVRMPAWGDPESFLNALRQGEILRRPKNLLYLQGLKWINDVSGRSKQAPASVNGEMSGP
jgi:predicted metal-dependent phosphoesterase TrpH